MRTELQTELQEIKQLLLLNNKTVLTPDEVSLMYGLSKDYLYHLTSERVIPFHKPNGKKIFFDKEEVEPTGYRRRNTAKSNVVQFEKYGRGTMTNIYYKSTYRTTMANNINIMQWICTENHSMTSDESVAHINIVFNTKYLFESCSILSI